MNKASCAFRTGYAHAMAGEAKHGVSAAAPIGSFARTDYDDGYQAGLNDKYWADHYEERIRVARGG